MVDGDAVPGGGKILIELAVGAEAVDGVGGPEFLADVVEGEVLAGDVIEFEDDHGAGGGDELLAAAKDAQLCAFDVDEHDGRDAGADVGEFGVERAGVEDGSVDRAFNDGAAGS